MKIAFPAERGPKVQVTSRFDEVRGDHVHGALDIIGPLGTPLRAIKDGEAMWHEIFLATRNRQTYNNWGNIKWRNGQNYPFANYTVEVYGGCCVLVCEGGREVFVYAHINPDLLDKFFTANVLRGHYDKFSNEEFCVSRWTEPVRVQAGDCVGFMGYAGQTLPGPYESHLHIEGHHGLVWNAHKDRIRVEDLLGV